MDTKELMMEAMSVTETLPAGTVFVVKELFLGTTWNNLMKRDKLSFGRVYKNAVTQKEIPNVVYLGKADNNSAQYQKIGEK